MVRDMIRMLLFFLVFITGLQAKEDPYLQELAMKYPYVRQLSQPPLAQWPSHDLGGILINGEGAHGVACAIMENTHLKSLNFRYCEMTDLTVRPILLGLVNHPSIENLDISRNNFSKETYKLLTRVLQNSPGLHSLDVSMNLGAFDESGDLLMEVFASQTLREFRYDFNIFQVEIAKKLNTLSHPNYSLEKLSFCSASFSTKALKEFAQSASQLKALKSLNLSKNGLTNNDAASLAQLAYNCPSLEEINFSANNTNYFFMETFEQTWKTLVHKRQSRNQKPLTIILSPKVEKADASIRNAVELLSGSRPVKFI